MVIQRSRKWIKDRIPAFICRETNWWVTRWIQCNVLVCPECRKEYKSLKSVWDCLDDWQVDEPEVEMENGFVENFRQKYPGAYRAEETQSSSTGFWLPRVAYLSVLALLGFAILSQPQVKRTAVRTVKETQSVPQEAVARAPEGAESRVAMATEPNERAATVANRDLGLERMHAPVNLPARGTRFRTTSTLEPAPIRRGWKIPTRARTVEINNMPVSAFDSLTQPYQDDRPY